LKKYDLVFEGGGVKGIAFVGALKRLEEEGVQISRVAGTSAGAITASLVAAGYTADELKKLLESKDFSDFADVKSLWKEKWYHLLSRIISLFHVASSYGIFSTTNFYNWIKELLIAKKITDFQSCPTYLRVFAVDIIKQKLVQFDKDCASDCEVADAVRMSMSIPLFFKAKIKEKEFVVDGGILANYPIDTFNDQGGLVTTIGLKLISDEEALPPKVPSHIVAYLLRIYETMQVAHERIHVEDAKWARTIPIPAGTISTIKFDITEDDKKFLWQSGYNAAEKALNEGLLTEEGRR
jgi:NTE family protein